MKSWGKGEWGERRGPGGGGGGGPGGPHAPPPSPIFCNHLFVAVTLKNYKLCYLN